VWPVVCRGTKIGGKPGNSPTLGNSFIISTNVLLFTVIIVLQSSCTEPDSSINKQNIKKKLDFNYFYFLRDLLSLKTDVNVPTKSNKKT
jgi:hypothetical protein